MLLQTDKKPMCSLQTFVDKRPAVVAEWVSCHTGDQTHCRQPRRRRGRCCGPAPVRIDLRETRLALSLLVKGLVDARRGIGLREGSCDGCSCPPSQRGVPIQVPDQLRETAVHLVLLDQFHIRVDWFRFVGVLLELACFDVDPAERSERSEYICIRERDQVPHPARENNCLSYFFLKLSLLGRRSGFKAKGIL